MSRRFPPIAAVTCVLCFAAATPPVHGGVSPAILERPAGDLIVPPVVLPPPPDDPADTCAILPQLAPDFSLEDVNPSSPTFGTVVPRTATAGDVTLLYIALASCGHCQSDTDHLGDIVTEQSDAWSEVSVRVVALNTAHEELPELADGHDLPILVDNDTVDIEGQYGASRWFIYLLDREGLPRTIHYELDFIGERTRLIEEVAALLAEERP